MAMTPEDMAAMQAEAGKEQGAGAATKIAQEVGAGLGKLAEMLDSSQGTTDEDRAQMAQIMSLYTDLVEKKLSASPGENPQEPEAAPVEGQAISAEGGPKGVPMGPNTRM